MCRPVLKFPTEFSNDGYDTWLMAYSANTRELESRSVGLDRDDPAISCTV